MSAVLPPSGGFGFPNLGLPKPAAPKGASRSTGLAVVVVLHVALGYALVTGLARKAVEVVRKPIQMAIVPEVAPPPPPPPPPKVEKLKELPKLKAPPPPPAYVPPTEVQVNAPPPPIQAVQAEPPKAPVEIAPPPPPAPPPEPPKPAVVKQEISVACPGYEAVLSQALEEAMSRVNIAGTVQTLIKIRGNQVVEVVPQSGPQAYYKYVQAAVKRMRCSAGGADEVQVTLPVIFAK
jgi:protein TonB